MSPPREYIPGSLYHKQEPRKLAFAIGIERKRGSFGMTDGPFDTEEECLETIGQRGSRIIRFNEDHTETLLWWWRKDRWIHYGN